VVAYAFTLSAPDETITQGQELFNENCSECHGEDGRLGTVDFTDQKVMSELSAQSLFDAITAGQGEMPDFAHLQEDDRWALTAYLRSLSFAAVQTNTEPEIAEGEAETTESGSPSETQSEAPLEAEETTGGLTNIPLKIVNGTSGTDLPADLEVTLRGYDNMDEVYTQTLKTNGGDEVIFENVAVPEGRMYFATMEYGNATYGSNVQTITGGQTPNELEIVFYQPTSDPSILTVDRLHVFVDFIDQETIEIYQLYIFSNSSDQVLIPAETGKPSISFTIPAEAVNFNVEENMSILYMKTADGFGIVNVYPDENQYQTLFSFQFPYDKKIDLELPIGMDTNAITVMLPDNGIRVMSDQLAAMGTQAIEGMSFNMYDGGSLRAGETLSLEISGRPKLEGGNIISNLEGNNTSLVIGLAGFGIALIAAGVYLWRRNRTAQEDWLDDELDEEPIEETSEDIMDAIITLDDQYKNGELPEGAYRQRRAELKERLREFIIS
jgi:cytochrome c553